MVADIQIVPNKKLQNWHKLEDQEFLTQIKKSKGCQLSSKQLASLLQYFTEQQEEAFNLQYQIDETNNEIDQMVYKLYGLTEKEIEEI